MAGIFQFGLRPHQAWPKEDRIADIRWALSALDPQSRLRCGVFPASDGANVPYRFWPAKQPHAALLLLHGCCDYAGAFDEIAPRLARRGFTCLAYDQRGFGATASRGDWAGVDRMVDDVADAAAFLRQRAGATLPLFVIGESMGGAVALHAAAKFPQAAIAGLVLVAPGALASAIRRFVYGWMARLIRTFFGDSEVVFERVSGWELTPAAAIRLIGDPLVMRSIKPEIFSGLVALGTAAVELAKDVNIPVLTLVAGRDDVLRQACIRRLYDNLAGPKAWHVIADAPHLLLHWRRGESVLREARHWILNRLMAIPAAVSADCASAPYAAAHRPDLPAQPPASAAG
jgi:acylglycerol lipase